MKLLIEIPDEKYNCIINKMYCGIYDKDIYNAIANGTPITDDVICDYKKYIKVLERIKGDRLAHVIANQIRIEIEKLEGSGDNGN